MLKTAEAITGYQNQDLGHTGPLMWPTRLGDTVRPVWHEFQS